MSEENQEQEAEEAVQSLPRMSDDELVEFVNDYLNGDVVTDQDIEEDMIPQVFMPLLLGAASQLEPVIENVGCVYEYTHKAGPRAVNGLPMFMSFNVMHKQDWKAAVKAIKKEDARRQTSIRIERDEEPEDSGE